MSDLFTTRKTEGGVRLRVNAGNRSDRPISRYLTGKFCEHLGRNIYNGMSAQILRNPTFSSFPFGARATPPDGGRGCESNHQRIADRPPPLRSG